MLNQYGVKDSANCYLNIKGKRYKQWSDFMTKEECQKQNPEYSYIVRKQPEGFTRIYKLVERENI